MRAILKRNFLSTSLFETPLSQKNSIFSNSSTYSVFETVDSSGAIDVSKCYFSHNEASIFFVSRYGAVPKFAFLNVVITENIDLGMKGVSYSTEGDAPVFVAGYSTAECFGHYPNELIQKCTRRLLNINLERIIMSIVLLTFIL